MTETVDQISGLLREARARRASAATSLGCPLG